MSMSYESTDGSSVDVPSALGPYRQLGISTSTSTSAIETKKVLKGELSRSSRQARALALLAYHMITPRDKQKYSKNGTLFEVRDPDIFTFATIGHAKEILARISENQFCE